MNAPLRFDLLLVSSSVLVLNSLATIRVVFLRVTHLPPTHPKTYLVQADSIALLQAAVIACVTTRDNPLTTRKGFDKSNTRH